MNKKTKTKFRPALTQNQKNEMAEIAKPVIKWMNENDYSHTTMIVQFDRIELFGEATVMVPEEKN